MPFTMNRFDYLPVRRFSSVIFCYVWLGTMTAWADQNDPRLEVLFDALQSTSDLQKGAFLTEQIWQRWREFEDPVIAGLLSKGITAMGANDLTAALDCFNQVVGRAPEFAEGWNKLYPVSASWTV